MSASNPTVTIEVTEKELAVLSYRFDFPEGNRYPHLQEKLSAAAKDMREAKRIKNRETKLARMEKRKAAEA